MVGAGDRYRRTCVRTLLRLIVVLMALTALTAGTVVALAPAAEVLPEAQTSVQAEIDLTALDNYAVRSYVYDADGGLLTTLHGPENRQPVALELVPEPVVQSILAVEDADFYHHGGVNLRATVRALLENVSEGGIVQGGSTITQQLVKNALLSADRQLDRKTEEAALALRLERELSKDEILELYLNTVYFGSGAYGVQAAAETYWGRPVSQLGWAEGAMLAALIANPARYDPTLDPEGADRQRRLALDRVVSEGHLTQEQADELAQAPLPAVRCDVGAVEQRAACGGLSLPPAEDYFVEDVKQALLNDPSYGLGATPEERFTAVFSGGIKVFTTLDPAAQFAAEAAIATELPANDIGVTAASISVENSTGAVRAMVGGPGFDVYKYNLATHEPGKPVGSTMKVFTLLTALEQGLVPDDTVDGGGEFPNPDGDPDPYEISGKGGTLRGITLASSNGAFVRLSRVVGIGEMLDTAARLGMTNPADDATESPVPDDWAYEVLSSTLGTMRQTPVEMASAYSAIPNGGLREPWYLIERVEDRAGNVLYQHASAPTRGVSRQTACLATDILQDNVRSGTGTRARLDRQPAAGKTGTSTGASNVWFVGFTPYITTAVWMGKPDVDERLNSFNGVQNFGGVYPARIWRAFNDAYHANRDVVPFPECEDTRSGRKLYDDGRPAGEGGSSRSSTSTRSSGTTPPTTTAPAGGGGGGGAPTTTAAPSPTTTAAPTPSTTAAPPPPSTTQPPAPAGGGQNQPGDP